MVDQFPKQADSELTYLVDQKNGDQMIKQLLNSVITKYQDCLGDQLFVSASGFGK